MVASLSRLAAGLRALRRRIRDAPEWPQPLQLHAVSPIDAHVGAARSVRHPRAARPQAGTRRPLDGDTDAGVCASSPPAHGPHWRGRKRYREPHRLATAARNRSSSPGARSARLASHSSTPPDAARRARARLWGRPQARRPAAGRAAASWGIKTSCAESCTSAWAPRPTRCREAIWRCCPVRKSWPHQALTNFAAVLGTFYRAR